MSDDDALDLRELSIKELLQLQCRLLFDVRDALVVQQAESTECEHPEEKRISLSSMGDLNHWVCGLCKFDNKTAPMH